MAIASSGCGAGGKAGSGQEEELEPWGCTEEQRVDLLLAIDNSRAMGDKAEILARTIPDIVGGFVNPRCVDAQGVPAANQPKSPAESCPGGTGRQYVPIVDVHIGVISSSIGGHGADSCPNTETTSCGGKTNTSNNDKGRLLARLDPCGSQEAPTYADKKFLAWDPGQRLSPPGESIIDDGQDGGLVPTLQDMVRGVGQIGCGYESQLESVYRFLVDPEPYESITIENGKATPQGIDTVLLAQRAEFLRSDSLLNVIMLSDENDCSIKEYGQFYYVGQTQNGGQAVRLPRARQECATNPNDPCCMSCGQSAGGCAPDPTCEDPNGGLAMLTQEEDSPNLRCFDQKRRFGIDFLYPTDRYVQAFSSPTIPNRAGDLVPNPIFSDLNPNDAISAVRASSEVLVMGLVGVPWQDIARDSTDASKGFKSSKELLADVGGMTTWDVILGDPGNYVKPKDPLMIESVLPRMGTNPITGDALTGAFNPNSNPINGHEWTIVGNDDLQYACIFPLLPKTERDCSTSNAPSCDCVEGSDNPLCDVNNPSRQLRGKAYPSIRQLAVLKGLGNQAAVGSVCPAQVNDSTKSDYGYRPAAWSIFDWLMRRGC